MSWVGALLGKVKGWAVLALVALGAVAIAFLRGRAEGRRLIEAEQDRRRAEAMRRRKELEDEVDQMGHGDIDSQYARWLRDDNGR